MTEEQEKIINNFIPYENIKEHYGGKIQFFALQMGVWITLMIATTIAVTLRYIDVLLPTLPFVIVAPLFYGREKQGDEI